VFGLIAIMGVFFLYSAHKEMWKEHLKKYHNVEMEEVDS